MKTPREILLARHQATKPKLDEIRRAVVAGLKSPPSALETPFVLKLWRELVWSPRWTWAGLATVWLTLAVFSSVSSSHSQTSLAKSTSAPGETRLAMQEQRRLLDEIISPAMSQAPSEPPRKDNLRPRSRRTTGQKLC